MANKPYVCADTPKVAQYFRIYRGLLEHANALGLNLTSVVLFSILLSRANLSYQNGWYDDKGRIYVIYTREDFARDMGCSKQTAIKAFRALVAAGLTEEISRINRSNCTLAPYIYVKQWNAPTIGLTISDIHEGALPYLTTHNIYSISDKYLELPIELIRLEKYRSMSVRAKILYAHIWNMTKLSLEHDRFDSDGRYWCEIGAKAAERLLNCGHDSVSRAYKELAEAGLVSRIRFEYGCAFRTYLHPIWVNQSGEMECVARENDSCVSPAAISDEASCFDTKNASQYADDFALNCLKTEPQSTDNMTQGNLTETSPQTQLHRDSIRTSMRDAVAVRKKFSLVDRTILPIVLSQPEEVECANEILSLAISVMTSDAMTPRKKIRIGKELVEKEDLIAAYESIDREIMLVLLSKLTPIWPSLPARVPYLRSSLFRAFEDHSDESYYMRCRLESLGVS